MSRAPGLSEVFGYTDERCFQAEVKADKQVSVALMGCTGTGGGDRQREANLQVLARLAPDVVMNLGDLGYTGMGEALVNALSCQPGCLDDGISNHQQLQSQLIDPVDRDGLSATIFFLLVGNHELNIHGLRSDKLARLSQSFLFTPSPALALNRRAVRQGQRNIHKLEGFAGIDEVNFEPKLINPNVELGDQSKVRKFQMMKDGYYTLQTRAHGAAVSAVDLETICLNTCTLPYDPAQIAWLIETINKSYAKHIILAGHHPFEAQTVGKRRFKEIDGEMYAEACAALHPEEAEQIRWRFKQLTALSRGPGHGDILAYIWSEEIWPKLSPGKRELIRAVMVAHDHHTAVSIGAHGIPQFVMGGGAGDKLDKPTYATHDPHCLYAKNESAVATVTVEGDQLVIEAVAGDPKNTGKTIPRFNAQIRQPTIDRPHKVVLDHTSTSKEDAGVMHRIGFRSDANGYGIDRAEKVKPTEPYVDRSVIEVTKEKSTLSRHQSLFDELETKLNELANSLKLSQVTLNGFKDSYEKNSRFKQLVDLLIDCRSFMYRLGKFYVKFPHEKDQVEQVLRSLISLIESIKAKVAHNSLQLQNIAFSQGDLGGHRSKLKQLVSQYGSRNLLLFDVIGASVLLILIIALFRVMVLSGDIKQQPESPASVTAGIGNSILVLLMTWFVQGICRWKVRPAVEDQFGNQLRRFVSGVVDVLEELQQPVQQAPSNYGTLDA